jgi:hypothetical protein
LILLPKLPPRLVVLPRRDLAVEHFPAPLIDHQSKRQEGNFLQRPIEQQPDILRRVRRLVEKSKLNQILGRDRKRDGIADGFVESVVGAVAEQQRQLVVGALIKVVTQLMMDGREILGVDLDAHLDAQIVVVVYVPG